MEEVKEFILNFANAEAKALSLVNSTDTQAFEVVKEELNSYLDEVLENVLVYRPKHSLDFADDLADLLDIPDDDNEPITVLPRVLFKISEYKHKKHGSVWAAFVSSSEPMEGSKRLSMIIYIIKKDEKLAVAGTNLYTHTRTDGRYYRWEHNQGYSDLVLEELEGPFRIDRYIEPSDAKDGLKNYQDNI